MLGGQGGAGRDRLGGGLGGRGVNPGARGGGPVLGQGQEGSEEGERSGN